MLPSLEVFTPAQAREYATRIRLGEPLALAPVDSRLFAVLGTVRFAEWAWSLTWTWHFLPDAQDMPNEYVWKAPRWELDEMDTIRLLGLLDERANS
jgi:hypothetical protein